MEKAVALNTHAHIKKLKNVGFTEQQAEVLASIQIDLVEKRFATRSDIFGLKRDIEKIRSDLKKDIEGVRSELKRDIEKLRAELKRDIEELKVELKRDMKEMELRLEAKISSQKVDLIKWVFGIAFAQATLIIALLKLL